MKTERRRVPASEVRDNAKRGGGGHRHFRLPKGVDLWEPEKPESYNLDVLPYEVKGKCHPDGYAPGYLWYKLPYKVHTKIGPNQEDVVCPTSLGKPCPICEDVTRLKKNWEDNRDRIKELSPKNWVAYNIKNPDDEERASVFAYSKFKFGDKLQEELAEGDESCLNFYQVDGDGRTLKARFSKDTFEGGTFLKCSRIDFRPRAEMDEDEILSRTVCLEEALCVMEYDEIKRLFLGQDATDDDKDDPQPPTSKKGSTKAKDDDDDKPAASPPAKDKAAAFKKGDMVQFTNAKGKLIQGKLIAIDDDEVVVEDSEGNEFNAEMDDLAPLAKAKTKAEAPADEPTPAAKSGGKVVVGCTVSFSKGDKTITGKVTEIDDDDVTIVDATGREHIKDLADVTPVAGSEAKKEPPAKAKAPTFEEGDDVSWDDGDKEGTIMKLHNSGTKAKVKDDEGEESWVPITELAKAKN